MRKVMIASPSHDGRVDVWHASALSETCKLGLSKNINVIAIYMSYDSLVQRARNDIVKLAIENDFDDLVFIDTDQDWNPVDFFRLLDHDVDVVAAPVRKKTDDEQYNVKLIGKYKIESNGLVEVNGVGTGMMRIKVPALRKIWESSVEYTEKGKETKNRMVFEVSIINGNLVSEDIVFCEKWRNLGGKVFIDPNINCGHVGVKKWQGNFKEWIQKQNKLLLFS